MTRAMAAPASSQAAPLRLGFLGVGWIGRHRMEAVLTSGLAEACAVCDPSPDMVASARALSPAVSAVGSLDDLIDTRPDGIVIATPSALHAAQAIRALEAGIAVFCQKPIARTGAEVAAVIHAARAANRLLGIDLSYRHVEAMRLVRERIRAGEIGTVYAVDLTFHNAYGPDKPWFYDMALAGGGCVMDLGVHLVDLLLWTLDFAPVEAVSADLYRGGRRLRRPADEVEDYAVVTLGLETGAVARLACSWGLNAGCDAVIGATFHGTSGALSFANVAGSFFDFTAELRRGTRREALAGPPDVWGGRAIVAWADHLAAGGGFDPDTANHLAVAGVLDRIYGR